MQKYKVKSKILSGSEYREVIKQARLKYHEIEKRTKRKPYLRSAYYTGEKIFFDYFWRHLNNKSFKIRMERLKYLPCAIELIKYSRLKPISKINPNRKQEILHRFTGETSTCKVFSVHIKENIKTRHKYLMSIFPDK